MYEIEWLAIGETNVPESITFHLGNSEKLRRVIAYAFLLKAEDGRYHLIDTGVRSPEEINAGRPPERHWKIAPSTTLLDQLLLTGVAPEDIDTVMLTHLHYDHCSQIGLFPNAQILVSRAEWLSVVAPVHKDMLRFTRYPRDVYGALVDSGWSRLRLITDMEEVLPGIEAWVLGGHTPGSTAYLIETAVGRVVVAGDFINTYANWEQMIPPGLLVSLDQWFMGYMRLAKSQSIVVPSHDPMLRENFADGLITQPPGANSVNLA